MNPAPATAPDPAASAWKGLYRAGGVAALLIVGLYFVEMMGVAVMGTPPATREAWFALFGRYGTLGLLDAYLLDAVAVAVSGGLFLALYGRLRHTQVAWATLATGAAFLGITLYLTTNITFSMLFLSQQYAAAATDAERALCLAAGQAQVAVQNGTAAYLSFCFTAVAGLIFSLLMLRTPPFGKVTAWMGIVANVCQLVEPPTVLVPADFYRSLGVVLILVSFVFYVFWYVGLAWTLFRLGRRGQPAASIGDAR